MAEGREGQKGGPKEGAKEGHKEAAAVAPNAAPEDVYNVPAAPPKDAPKETKLYPYECMKKCVYRGKFYREGEMVYLERAGEAVSHFKEKGSLI